MPFGDIEALAAAISANTVAFLVEPIQGQALRQVRGRGLMLAVEPHPEAGGARRYCQALQERGLLCKETHDHTIRIAPPLVITSDQVDWAVEQFDAVLRG